MKRTILIGFLLSAYIFSQSIDAHAISGQKISNLTEYLKISSLPEQLKLKERDYENTLSSLHLMTTTNIVAAGFSVAMITAPKPNNSYESYNSYEHIFHHHLLKNLGYAGLGIVVTFIPRIIKKHMLLNTLSKEINDLKKQIANLQQ